MTYQIVDLENKVLQTLETEEQLKELFAKAETNELEYNLFYDDEGLVDTLKKQQVENGSTYAIVKFIEE